MNVITDLLWYHGNFLGIEWHVWKVVGWLGNVTFFSRFVVQWYVTERQKRVVIPVAFWWLSLSGSLLLLSYAAFYQHDSVFIFANAFSWIPYIRNLVIHHRHLRAEGVCPACEHRTPPEARFCHQCGARLEAAAV